jgi:hypothetical protein
MSARKPPPRPLSYDDAMIARLCERVYRARLEGDAEKMIEKDGDDGHKLRLRALAYAPVVRATLDAMKEEHAA